MFQARPVRSAATRRVHTCLRALSNEQVDAHGVDVHRLELAFQRELSLRFDDNGIAEPGTRVPVDQDRSAEALRLCLEPGPADDPYQAALGFTVSLDKPGGFVGRDAIRGRASTTPDRRQVFVRLEDPEPLLLHGESVLRDGEIVGQITSGAYGHTVGAACGLAYVRGDAPADAGYEVDCAGTRVRATASDTPLYDPTNTRLRG